MSGLCLTKNERIADSIGKQIAKVIERLETKFDDLARAQKSEGRKHTMKFQDQFKAARRAATPLVAVRTADPWSSVNEITSALNGKSDQVPLMVWDLRRGLQGINKAGSSALAELLNGGDARELTRLAVDMLDRLESLRRRDCIIVMMNAHLVYNDHVDGPAVVQAVWNLREILKNTQSMLVMTVTAGAILPAELANDVLVLDQPLPTAGELKFILNSIFRESDLPPLNEKDEEAAIDAVAGLAAFPAEQVIAMSASKQGIDIDALWERKRQTIEQQAGMTVHRGEAPEPVGIDNIRAFIKKALAGRKRYRAILLLDEAEKAFAGTGTDLSGVKTGMTGTWCSWVTDHDADGLLCIGMPGGGKTMMAKWAGSIANIPTIIFDLSGMQSGVIGSTEERLRSALKTIDAISQGSVLIIGTCNAIGQMPPEVLRRFNLGTFFFDLMSPEERAACWKFYAKKYEITSSDSIPDDDGWTGSEIKECCKLAYQLRIPLVEASAFVVPVARSSAERIKALRQSASGKYISASTPGVYKWEEQLAETV